MTLVVFGSIALEPTPIFQRLAELSVAVAMVYIVYLIIKQIVSALPRKESQNHQLLPSNLMADVAVLKSEMGTIKSTVVPITELVGDVKVILDAIDDLRARVRDLEQIRRREGGR